MAGLLNSIFETQPIIFQILGAVIQSDCATETSLILLSDIKIRSQGLKIWPEHARPSCLHTFDLPKMLRASYHKVVICLKCSAPVRAAIAHVPGITPPHQNVIKLILAPLPLVILAPLPLVIVVVGLTQPNNLMNAQDEYSPASSDFETELATYIAALKLPEEAARHAQDLLRGHDFASARAAMMTSIPGGYTGTLL